MNKVSGHYLGCIIEACSSLGLSKDIIFSKLAVLNTAINDPLKRFDGDCLVRLYELAATELNEPNIGFKVGTKFNVSWLNETGKLLPFCSTLGEVGLLLGRYHRLTQSFGASQVHVMATDAALQWQANYDDVVKYRHVIEAIFTSMILATKWLLWNGEPAVEYVQFRHSSHGDVKAYEDLLGCPVHFESEIDAIVVNSASLNAQLVTRDASMKIEICRKLDRLMLRLSDETALVSRVEASIREQLHEVSPKFSITAEHLRVNERHLRNKLKRQSTSFRHIVETVRREICEIEMQRRTQMSVIAQRLGFHDQSAFNHAFHKWYGVSPREYQSNHSAALGAK